MSPLFIVTAIFPTGPVSHDVYIIKSCMSAVDIMINKKKVDSRIGSTTRGNYLIAMLLSPISALSREGLVKVADNSYRY